MVIAIIGILSAVGIPAYQGFQQKAKYNSAKANFTNAKAFIMAEISKCNGRKPWHGPNIKEECGEEVIGLFTNQTSLYQPVLKSSLFIPVDEGDSVQEIDLEFQNNRFIKYEVNDFFQVVIFTMTIAWPTERDIISKI